MSEIKESCMFNIIVAGWNIDKVSELRSEEFKEMDVKQKGIGHANIS